MTKQNTANTRLEDGSSVSVYHHLLKTKNHESLSQPKNIHEKLYETLEFLNKEIKDATPKGKRWFDSIPNKQRILFFFDNKTGVTLVQSVSKPPAEFGFTQTDHSFKKGDVVRVKIKLACQRKKRSKPNESYLKNIGKTLEEYTNDPRFNQPYKMNVSEKYQYVLSVLQKAGLDVQDLCLSETYQTEVGSINFNIATNDVTAVATITDPALFEKAVLFGVGNYKAYGFGLVRFSKIS